MLTFVTFKWKPQPRYRSQFGPEAVNALRRMVARHYPHEHRFVCVTDNHRGIGSDVEIVPLWDDHATVVNPNGRHNPSCYRRLKLFAPDAGETFGERIVCMDLDTVIVSDLTPLFAGGEDFKIWGQSDYPRSQWYNGSLWMLRTGALSQVWTEFDPRTSPRKAASSGAKGSDQGWLSYILGPKQPTWGMADGVYSYRVHIAPHGNVLPENAKFIAFHGKTDPWSYRVSHIPWIREHYGAVA